VGPKNKSKESFVFRKIIGQPGSSSRIYPELMTVPVGSEVEINSEPLQELLGSIMSKWGPLEQNFSKLRSPYENLIYGWDEASKEACKIVPEESEEVATAREDLGMLLNLIKDSSGDLRLDRYFSDRDAFLEGKTITFEALWTLFPPGRLVLARPCLDEWQVFSVECTDGFVMSRRNPFELVCYSFDWNGSEFNRVAYNLSIDNWGKDRKKIVELPIYPLEYYEGGKNEAKSVDDLKRTLIDRGKDYRKYCISGEGKKMFNYDGYAYFHKRSAILENASGDDHASRSDDESSTNDRHEMNMHRSRGGPIRKSVCNLHLRFQHGIPLLT
jgi:hypothetical protein